MSLRLRTRVAFSVLLAVLLFPAYSQTKSGATSTGTGPTGTLPSNPEPTTTTQPTNNGATVPSTNTAPSTIPSVIRLSGRVMTDDGSPLPSSGAVIERVCNGNAHPEGYTDSTGYFYVSLGQALDMVPEADKDSMGSGPRPATQTQIGAPTGAAANGGSSRPGVANRYANCELRAKVPGYISKSVNLFSRTAMDDPDIGTILIHRLGESEKATTVTATSLRAPREARKAFEKGLELEKKDKPEQALASFQQAVKVYPEYALAWCELGKLQGKNGDRDEAYRSFDAAAKAEPRWPEPYLMLAFLNNEKRDWRAMADYSDRVLRLNSFEYPEAFFLNAAANFNLHHFDVAEKAALSAERLDTQHRYPQIAFLLGIILSDRHQYPEAAERLRTFLTLDPTGSDAPAARKRLEQIQKVAAETPAAPTKDQR